MSAHKQSMNTAASVYARIRDAIVDGRLPSGTPLKQDQLASEFGVSKIPVREALVLLEADGFVESFPGRGAIVAKLSREEVEEIYLMRRALEPILLNRSIGRTPAVTWGRADGVLAALATGKLSSSEWHELDQEFHSLLYQHAGLPRIQKLVSNLHSNLARYYALYQALGSPFYDLGEHEHRELLNACKAGNVVEADDILAHHLERTSNDVLEALQPTTVTEDDA
ncbi:MAG: GntR family transcriptional regulator [Anaerolineae bacterium]|nr:GntR family transcriptional regulator [Anaerolineae bacterium]